MGIGEWCAGKARQAWWATTDLWKLIWACRAPFVAIAAGGLLIAQTDQARDIVIATSSPKEGGLPIPLAVLLWASMGWYWSRITLEFMKGEAARSPVPVDPEVAAWGWAPGWRCFWSDHLPRLIGAAAIFSVAVAFWRAHNVYARYGDFASAAIFLRQAAFYLVATGVFYAVVAYRKELMEWVVGSRRGDRWRRNLVPERAPLRQFNDIAPLAKWILYLSVLGSPVFFLLFAFVPIQTAALLGSAVAVILVGLALAVAAPSFLVIWSIRTRMPLLGTACVLFFVMPWLFGDNHDVRTCRALQSAGNAGKACVDKDYADRPFVRDVFNAWYEANKKITKPIEGPGTSAVAPPMIVVATAGGASRAAYFTTQVLGEIASREENFAERLFLLSGVSGGSLGATVFRSLVEVKRRSSVDKEGMVGLMKDAAKDGDTFIDHDFLAPALGVGFYVDAPYSAVSFLRSRWAPYGGGAGKGMGSSLARKRHFPYRRQVRMVGRLDADLHEGSQTPMAHSCLEWNVRREGQADHHLERSLRHRQLPEPEKSVWRHQSIRCARNRPVRYPHQHRRDDECTLSDNFAVRLNARQGRQAGDASRRRRAVREFWRGIGGRGPSLLRRKNLGSAGAGAQDAGHADRHPDQQRSLSGQARTSGRNGVEKGQSGLPADGDGTSSTPGQWLARVSSRYGGEAHAGGRRSGDSLV
jgi:hypothetical protein